MPEDENIRIAVAANSTARQQDAETLAKKLNLPFTTNKNGEYDYLLIYSDKQLELQKLGRKSPGPVYVDFLHGALQYRHQHISLKKEPLARAVGLKKDYLPDVIDATAGLGRDASLLAAFGCKVRMVERSSIIAALLQDGLQRCDQSMNLNMQLIEADAIAYLTALIEDQKPDVVYLDPMYPERNKSALVKKEMRYFQDILGKDTDTPALLTAALKAARRRVVVKRPRLAESITGPQPATAIIGKTTRYDIYINHSQINT